MDLASQLALLSNANMAVVGNRRFYCSSCGRSHRSEKPCVPKRNVVFSNAESPGTIHLGGVFSVTGRVDTIPSKEADNLKMLRSKTTLPVTAGICGWTGASGVQYSITTCVEGVTLAQAWYHLAPADRRRIARQTGYQISKLRSLVSDRGMRLGGEPLYNGLLFRTRGTGHGIPHGPVENDDEVWHEMLPGLDGHSEETKAHVRALMPPCRPYTFTHGGLTMDNIIIRGGNLLAIVGWEYAGYFPLWWEHVALRRSGICQSPQISDAGVVWRGLLLKEMPQYPQAWQFWAEYDGLCDQRP